MQNDKDHSLVIDGLTVSLRHGARIVDGVSFSVRSGETVSLVGESGSGKSVTARAITGLLAKELVSSGSVTWRGTELIGARQADLSRIRGDEISLLLQDPFTMLNPLSPIGRSLGEGFLAGRRRNRTQAKRVSSEVEAALRAVGIAADVASKYPWELSGGMRQRVGLAAAISRGPGLLIADEPTTALDATTQREALSLIRRLQRESGTALLLITHDLRVAMSMSDRVIVMSDGHVVEESDPTNLKAGPRDPYTRRLWAAELPLHRRLSDLRVDARTEDDEDPALVVPERQLVRGELVLSLQDVRKRFGPTSSSGVDSAKWALGGVSLDVHHGTSVGVIGESGSGKTTLARCVLGLEVPTSGSVDIYNEQQKVPDPGARQRGAVQCIFQDPYSSLNPAHSIGFTLREAVRHRPGPRTTARDADLEIAAMLESVELSTALTVRRPHSLSGGQRQRVAIARALLMKPALLVCDEPVAALDLTVQSQVLHVLRKAQQEGTSMLFITHDLSVARQMTDELVVLSRGEVVESGVTADVLAHPQHSYTQRLLESVPTAAADWLSGTADARPAAR